MQDNVQCIKKIWQYWMDLVHGTCQVDSPQYVYSSDWVGVVLKDKEACVTRSFLSTSLQKQRGHCLLFSIFNADTTPTSRTCGIFIIKSPKTRLLWKQKPHYWFLSTLLCLVLCCLDSSSNILVFERESFLSEVEVELSSHGKGTRPQTQWF